jgi:hypothetical protein
MLALRQLLFALRHRPIEPDDDIVINLLAVNRDGSKFGAVNPRFDGGLLDSHPSSTLPIITFAVGEAG